jgi:hypothetical protein
MAVRSGYELEYRRDGGYGVKSLKGTWLGMVCPLADGKGWFILGDPTVHAWATKEDAADEMLRQYEDMKAKG